MDFAILGAGCFWCIEALFLNIPGIVSVEAGYTGGHIKDPTYEFVCSGKTGHVEVCQIKFNFGAKISTSSHNIPSNGLHTCLKSSFSAFPRYQNFEN